MNVIWYKVWSDLWDNKVRTTLAVLSIAAGVFAIGVVFGMVDQLLVGMDSAHQAVNPSHIRLFLVDPITRDTADRLEHIDGVEKIELIEQTPVRYKLKPDDEWRNGSIVMRYDYEDQTYEQLQLKAGLWPDKKRIAVERLSSQYFGIELGDKIIFELAGSDRLLPVASIVRDSFVPPPQFGGDAAFYIGEGGLERFGVSPGKYDQLLIRVRPYDPELARAVASEIKDKLAKDEVDVAVTFYQDPQEHWGRRFVVGQNLILEILAGVSLFLSLILILNTLTALITQQTHQIGIIKAIGGQTGSIIKIYLAGVLVYGLLAWLISWPLGAFLAYGLTRWFLNLFNIDYETFQFSNRVLVLQGVAAIVAPLLAALWPVLSGATVTVREAIASYGLGSGQFGHRPFDRLIEWLGQRFLPGPFALAWGNIFRRKGRLILTQLVLITAGVMFLVIMSLTSSISLTMDNYVARRAYDIEVVFEENERIDQVVDMAGWLTEVEAAQVWFRQSASILKAGQRVKEAGIGAFLYGLPLKTQMFQPLMAEGRWLQADDGRVIVISEGTARNNDIEVGDMVTVDLGRLGKNQWRVVGIYQVVLNGGFDIDPIYASQAAVFAATTKHNEGDSLYIRTYEHTPDYTAAVATSLKNLYEQRKIDVSRTQTTQNFRQFVDSQFGISISMLFALAVLVALVGGIGLMGSLSISVVERTREIGVMRAIGAKSPILLSMFVMEGVLQGLLSWLLALPISFVLGRPLTQALGNALEVKLDYQYSFEAVLYWLVAILIISILASILPARNATGISVRDSLAYT